MRDAAGATYALILSAILGSVIAAPEARAESKTYVYDALGRLIEVQSDVGGHIVYSYDPAGNRVQVAATGPLPAQDFIEADFQDLANLWHHPEDASYWGLDYGSVAGAGQIAGMNAYSLTASSAYARIYLGGPNGAWTDVTATAGQTAIFTVTLKGVGSLTSDQITIYGSGSWGSNAQTARIISGPGAIGNDGYVTGLSTTQPTRVQVQRTTPANQAVGGIVNVNAAGSATSGQAVVISAPSFVLR